MLQKLISERGREEGVQRGGMAGEAEAGECCGTELHGGLAGQNERTWWAAG